MTRNRFAWSSVVTVAGVWLAITVGSPLNRTLEAQSWGQGASIVGTWFFTAPVGLTGFCTYEQGGTFTCVRSHEFGGSPRPGSGRSNLSGVWRRVGGGFESVSYSYSFDTVTLEATGITRVRSVSTFDGDFDTTVGEFFVAQWTCPTSLTCPNPTRTAPDVAEFAGGQTTSTRVRLP